MIFLAPLIKYEYYPYFLHFLSFLSYFYLVLSRLTTEKLVLSLFEPVQWHYLFISFFFMAK